MAKPRPAFAVMINAFGWASEFSQIYPKFAQNTKYLLKLKLSSIVRIL